MSNDPITLNDLLGFDPADFWNIKVKFHKYNGSKDPRQVYLDDPELVNTEWLLWHQKSRYFPRSGMIAISLVRMNTSNDLWLLTTVKQIDDLLDVSNDVGYKAHELDRLKPFFGRVIVKYCNTDRQMGKFYENVADAEVVEVLSNTYSGDDFPGFDQVCLSYDQLKNVLTRQNSNWIGALCGQKAVYVIADKSNGKLYVGSATSDNGMLLHRWQEYASNGHGGNKELKALIKSDPDYAAKNFQYSIIENYNSKVSDDLILAREAYWKRVLDTRDHGYNDN